MTTCVVGLGKIGLPLAVQIASKGENVIGCDINEEVVDLINKGEVPFPGETNLAELLLQVRQEDLLKASIDTTQAVQLADTVVVVVPVIVDETAKPDFSAIDSATRDIAGGLKQNTLIWERGICASYARDLQAADKRKINFKKNSRNQR